MDATQLPGWFREIRRFAITKPVFLLSGNVRDLFLTPQDRTPRPLLDFLVQALKDEGYSAFLAYDPVDGFRNLEAAEDLLARFHRYRARAANQVLPEEAFAFIRQVMTETRDRHLVVLADYASRLAPDMTHLSPTETRVFTLIEKISHEVTHHMVDGRARCNLLILILQKENDVPSWLVYRNPGIHSVVIPLPYAPFRRRMAELVLPLFPQAQSLDPEQRERLLRAFVARTEQMRLRDIRAIALLAREQGIPVSRLEDAVRQYKTGVRESPWLSVLDRIEARGREILDEHIKGQEAAKRHILQVLKRAALGLSGSHLGLAEDRPKGVFFFAGPTGVGKTAMARAIAELVFGDPTAYIRFDMSEFSEPHTNQRLIGAPPGYVGYEQGGELTNAVRENPFSLLLFDEIEKAHPRIFDVFLQILDAGRLTDSKGETVYFGETLIVFTSNLGVYREDPDTGRRVPLISPEAPYSEVQARILRAIEDFFRFQLARPEIFNRIGRDNILVFDFIRPPVAQAIFDKFLGNFLRYLKQRYGLALQVRPETYQRWLQTCTQPQYLQYGGRGIAQAFEIHVVNALTDTLSQALRASERELEV